jgi:hypothetical protein
MLPVEGITTATEVPKVLERAKLGFALALRQAFASSLTHKDLKYSTDKAKTKIKIYTAHPLTMEFFPCLVVSASSGDASVNFLQDEYIGTVEDSSIVTYGGKIIFTVSITVITNGTVERERIMDHITFFIRHLFKDVFRSFNLEYSKGITIGAENVTEVDNRPICEQTISIPCYMEWSAGIDQAQLETVRKIIIAEVLTMDRQVEII